ncbi:MAG: methyltransferase domain-containing protein, partial [Rhodospirillaceae bacterium]
MPDRTIPSSTLQTGDKTEYDGVGELWAVEKCLPGYNRDIVRNLAAWLPRDGRILDFGAGVGTLACLWQAETGRRPDCLEIDASLRDVIASRGFRCFPSVEALGEAGQTYDGVYTSNVLEHVED